MTRIFVESLVDLWIKILSFFDSVGVVSSSPLSSQHVSFDP